MAAFNPGPIPAPNAAAAPLPPLPDLSSASAPGAGGGASTTSPLASLMSGIMPVKSAVDEINAACQKIVQSKVIPGGEQVCGQIVALATSLLPMAAQAAMQPGQGGGVGPSIPMPPPPGGPAPLG